MDISPHIEPLTAYLEQLLTAQRMAVIDDVMSKRTDHISVALENVYQRHNASAVLRSCECFGVQTLHAIQTSNEFHVSKSVAVGAGKWVDVIDYSDTGQCIEQLRSKGYSIAATSLREPSTPISELPIDKPVALFFGTEDLGLSEQVHDEADYFVKVPMFGFTQSFNISVSAALCISNLVTRLHECDFDWGLSEDKKKNMRLSWYLKSVKSGRALVSRFLQDNNLSQDILESLLRSH